ncbi:amidoligase family protein [Methylobacterium oryzihabitans]|nr:amidoligase family protein [Methylobacterium oryzihabitans]
MTTLEATRQAAGAFEALPETRTTQGRPRRNGVEIEFMGLSARAAALALAGELGGRLDEEDPHAFRVVGTRLGDLKVELDLRLAHPQRRRTPPPGTPPGAGGRWLGAVLSPFVPRELITEPLPVERMAEVDALPALLNRHGAKGRGAVAFGSLGLHFNVEPADPDRVLDLLKAYLLLEPRLRDDTAAGGGFWAVRGLPPPFPAAYVGKVVAPDYRPDPDQFARDYLAANPTRLRGLDLLPFLGHRDEAGVRAALPKNEKVSPRPVLHYRVPQAHVGLPGWSLAQDWNRWVGLERLAADRPRLDALGAAWTPRP